MWALAADTDGIGGVEDNAGAYVAPTALARARRPWGSDPSPALITVLGATAPMV